MSAHTATVEWLRGDQPFTDKRYRRAHVWRFDGGAVVPASSAPAAVPPPLSDPAGVDPEEALVAAVSSCQMLWFLAFAAGAGLVVDRYLDEPAGEIDRDPAGRRWLARIALRPTTTFSGRQPDPAELEALHRGAHDHCEMAHSVRAEITIEARLG